MTRTLRQRRALEAHNALHRESRRRVLNAARKVRQAEQPQPAPARCTAGDLVDLAIDATIVLAALACVAGVLAVLGGWVYS